MVVEAENEGGVKGRGPGAPAEEWSAGMSRAAIIPLVVLLVAMLVVSLTKPSKASLLVEELLAKQLTSNYMRTEVEDAIRRLTQGTRFEEKWQINTPIIAGMVNIFILLPGIALEDKASDAAKALAGTCAYLGDDNIIVLDTWYLNRFLMQRKIGNVIAVGFGPLGDSTRNQRNLVVWVLGHELGHLISGHRASHFSPKSLEVTVGSASFHHRKEFEADEWLLAHFRRSAPDIIDDFLKTLVDVLHAEILNKRLGFYPAPFDGAASMPVVGIDGVVNYGESGSHPEFVIRIARLMELISDIPTPAHELLQQNVRDFIGRLKKNG